MGLIFHNKRIYVGIGSRKTPPIILACMEEIGAILQCQGWLLRWGSRRY